MKTTSGDQLLAMSDLQFTAFDLDQTRPPLALSYGRLARVNQRLGRVYLDREKSGLRVFSLETLKSVADLSGLGQVYEVSVTD